MSDQALCIACERTLEVGAKASFCSGCFEHLSISHGLCEDGRRAIEVSGYYRRSNPEGGGFCSHLDPRPLVEDKRRLILARASAMAEEFEQAAKGKADHKILAKLAVKAGRAKALLSLPKAVSQIARGMAKSERHAQARQDVSDRLAGLVKRLTVGWIGVAESALDVTTNARNGYHAFKFRAVEQGDRP